MFLAPEGNRDAQKKGVYWRWLAVPALVMFMTACEISQPPGSDDDDNGGTTPPPTAEAMTHAEFVEFVTGLEADVSAALDDLTPMVALQLAMGATANASMPGMEVDGVTLLPRGKWEVTQDEHGIPTDWTRVGDLAGPGELQFTADVALYEDETAGPEFHQVDYAIDWQANGVNTTELELYGESMEFPRGLTVRLDSEQGTIADLSVRLEPESIVHECTDDWGTWSDDVLVVTSLLLNGTVGAASDLLLRAVDVGFEIDEAGSRATTEGEISVAYATHSFSAAWDASLTVEGDLLDSFGDLGLCGTADLDGLRPELRMKLLLSLNDTDIGFRLQAGTEDGESISVDLAVEADGVPALTISGPIDLDGDEPLNNLVVSFNDEELSFTEFIDSVGPIFAEEL